ncbi:MAG: peptidoglycan DD-metalloendopeptidase family protein [Bacilli bacterium]
MANAATYIGNLGKSISYSAVDKIKQMTPTASSFIETNQELFKEVYSSIKNYKTTVHRTTGWFKQTKVYEAGDQFKESIFEDIRTGKFYNKERIDKIMIKSMGSLGDFGDDQSSFDMGGLDGLGDDLLNDDFGSWDGTDGDKLVSNAITQASLSSAEAISKTIARSSEYMVESNKTSTNILYTQNAKAFSLFNQNLTSINENIANVLNFSTSTLQTHSENSKLYYETTTKLLQEQTALLKQLVDYNTPKQSTKSNSKTKKVGYDDVVDVSGAPDLREYGKVIKQNLMNKIGSISSMNSAFGDDSNILLNYAAAPLKIIPDFIVKKMVPDIVEKSMGELNKSLEGFFGSLLMKFNTMAKNDNPILQMIGSIFGISNNVKSNIDTGNYNKGPVPFDGKTRKAIIDVIPAYLRRIEAALTGTTERVFDFERGAYSNATDINKAFDTDKNRFVNNATADMKEYFMEASKNIVIENKHDRDQFMKDMDNFFKRIYSSNKLFDVSASNNEYSEYGTSPTNFQLFKSMYANAPKSMQQKINAEILSQRSSENKYMQNLEDNSDGGIYSVLFDRSGSENFNNSKKNKEAKGFGGLLLNAKDNLGHNVFYYMQKSLLELMKLVKLNSFSADINTASAFDIDTLRDLRIEDSSGVTEEKRKAESERRASETYAKKQEEYAKKNPHLLSYNSLYGMDEVAAGRALGNTIQNTNLTKALKAKNAKKDGLLDKLLAAESLSDKSKVVIENLQSISKKPAEFLAHTIDKVDQRLYDIIYDKPIKTKDGKDVKGFLNAMVHSMQNSFDKINSWIDEKILNPVKKKMGGETIGAIVKNMFKGMGIDIEDISKRIKLYFFGDKDTGQKGLFSDIADGIKRTFSDAFNYAKQAMKDVYTPIYTKIKGHPPEEKSKSIISTEKIKEVISGEVQEHADGTRIVKKTGLTAISEGEMIIPSEMNPFYNKKTDKMSQKKKEKSAKNSLASKISKLINGEVRENADGDQPIDETEGTGAGAIGQVLKHGIAQVKTSLFGESSGKEKEKFSKVVSDVTSHISEYAPSAIGAGLLGAGVSLITGAVGGPLLGAAVGAGLGIIRDSETVRTWLFGDMKDGERQGGVISKDIVQNMNKYLPDMAKYGVAGAITSILPFVPGGPIAGLIVGAGVGFAKNSESVQKALFGEDDGILGPNAQKSLERAIPHMLIGTGIGLFTGPFGFVGNAMVGAGLGLLTSTNTFQDMMFGEPDKDGKRTGGIMGEIKVSVVDPLKEFGNKFKKEVIDFIRDEMAKPLRNAMKPISKQIELAIKGMFTGIGNTINKMFESTMGIPLNRFITDKIIAPFTKVFGGLFKMLSSPAKFLISSPFKAIGAIGDHFRLGQIRSGNADYMTAQERLDFRKQKGRKYDKFSKFDNMIKDMDIESLDDIFGQLSNIKNIDKNVKRDVKSSGQAIGKGASDILNRKGDYDNIKKLTKLVQDGNVRGTGRFINRLGLDKDRENALKTLLEEKGATFYGSRAAQKDIVGAKNKLYEKLHDKGFSDINDSNISKYMDMFNKEKKSRLNTPEMTVEQKQGKEIIDILKKTFDEVKLLNDPDRQAKIKAQAEALISKTINKKKVFEDKYTYDMYGNPMKITHDKQGDETLDISDTDTVKAMKAQDERDTTQKGILKKLGFLEGLKKLFGIGNDKGKSSEKSVMEKIMEMVSAAAALAGLSAMYQNGDLAKLKTAFQNIIGYEGDNKGFNDAMGHGFMNFTTRGFSMGKLLSRIPIFGKVLGPMGKIMDAPAKMLAKSKLGLPLMGEKAVKRVIGKDQADLLMDKAKIAADKAAAKKVIKDQSFKAIRDKLKAAGLPYDSLSVMKYKAKDVADNLAIKGMYAYDKVKPFTDPIIKGAKDIGETIAIKGMHTKDAIGNKIESVGNVIKKSKVYNTGASVVDVIADRLGIDIIKNKSTIKTAVDIVSQGFDKIVVQNINKAIEKTKTFKKDISQKFIDTFDKWIINPLKIFGEGITKKLTNVADSIAKKADELTKGVKGGAQKAGAYITEKAMDVKNVVVESAQKAGSTVKEGTVKVGEKISGRIIKPAIDIVKDKSTQLVDTIANTRVGKAVSTLGKEISTAYTGRMGKILTEDVVEEVGEAGAKNGVIRGLINKIKERFSSILTNSVILKKIGKAGAEALKNKAIPVILVEVEKVAAKAITKAASCALAPGLINAFWIASGFIDGYNDANRILGINTEPTLGEKAVAGLISGANEIIFGILPESLLVNIFMKYLAPVFGMEDSKLAKEREAAQTELDKVNAERAANGEEALTMRQYQEQLGLGGSMGHRVGMSIGKTVSNFGERVSNLVHGRGWNTDDQLESGETTGKRAAAIVEKLKDIGKKGINTITAPVREVIDMALGKSDKDYWDVGSSNEEDSGFMGGLKDLITLTERVVLSPVYYTLKAGKTMWDHIKDNPTMQAVLTGGKFVFDLIKYNINLALSNTNGEDINPDIVSAASINDSDPDAGMKKVLFYGVNTLMLPIYLGLKIFTKVKNFAKPYIDQLGNGVKTIWGGIKDIASFVWEDVKNIGGLLAQGDFTLTSFSSFYTMPTNEDDESMGGGLKTAMFTISRIIGTVPFTVGMLLRQIPKQISPFFNLIKNAASSVVNWVADVAAYSAKDGWEGYWTNPNKDSTGLSEAGFMVGRVLTAPVILIGKVLNKFNIGGEVKKFITGKIDSFQKNIVQPFLDFFDLDKYWNTDKKKGRGSNLNTSTNNKAIKSKTEELKEITAKNNQSGGGSNISQIDPSIKNKRFGNSTIGDAGCAPATAAMMINNNSGNAIGIGDTADTAQLYQTQDGGVKAKYFDTIFKKYGMRAQYSENQKEILSNLKSGNSMVLLGQDNTNKSKSSSPFGSNPHYVVANGLNKNGNIIINDPEAPNGKTSIYNTNKILGHSVLGITAKNKSGGSSKLGDLFSGKGITAYPSIAYQKLNKFSKLSDIDLNIWINKVAPANSPFRNNGDIFNAASAASGLDPRYIVAHAAHESGWGTSAICRQKGNYFGIGAFDSSPGLSAYYMGSGLKAGIVEGAKWIAKNYINQGQDTLYAMEYGAKRYATAVDQWINGIASIMSGAPSNGSATSSNSKESSKSNWSGFDTKLGEVLSGLTANVFSNSFTSFIHGSSNENDDKDPSAMSGFSDNSNLTGSNAAKSANSWFLKRMGGSKVTSPYGVMRTINGIRARHTGIDYGVAGGTPIPSTVSGIVTKNISDNKGFGNHIGITDQFGTEHIYAHMKSKSPLTVGARVVPGTIVGFVGSTGNSTGNHLHYQVNTRLGTVNPESYLNSYQGAGSKSSRVKPIDLSSYKENKLVKSPLLNESTMDKKSDIESNKGKGGNDQKDSNMDLILSIIKLLVKIIDNTDKLSDIIDILKTEFSSKNGKGSDTKLSESSDSKKTAKDKILYMINNSTSNKTISDNAALIAQLDALARE